MLDSKAPHAFRERAQRALADKNKVAAVAKATNTISERRAGALEEVPDWQSWRSRARDLKAHVLENLPQYLEQFEERATARGVKVHWARDGKAASKIVFELAERAGEGAIVKAKSMVTEEIELNHALEARDYEPLETDLGERILQLGGQMPSHIVAPALHLSRDDVADIFVKELGVERTNVPTELTAIARRLLRESFAKASLGISGANFGVAETGSILVLENEGNIRLSTSVPKIHVALMGIEKLIPRMADLGLFLRLLPRSGTGQRLTAYQSILSGVDPTQEGPEEMHVILVDNGRADLLAHPTDRQTLSCIRCGACQNVCPVYRAVGGHAYGAVYGGPIGAILTPHLAKGDQSAELPYASSLCSACRDVCPVKIDIPKSLLRLRSQAVSDGRRGRLERVGFRAWARTMESPGRYRRFIKTGRVLQGAALGQGFASRAVQKSVSPLGAWMEMRAPRPLAKRSFRELWAAGLNEGGESRG